VLSSHSISIASVIQHEPKSKDEANAAENTVPLVIMTHEASEGAASRATTDIEALPAISGQVVRMPVRE
jgi:homoserine dehydrogenase